MQWLMEVVRPGRSGMQERPQGSDIGLGLRSSPSLSAIPGMDAPTLVPGLEGGMDPSSKVKLEPVLEVNPRCGGGIELFILWSPGTWGEPMLMDEHFFSLSVGWLVGWCQKWTLLTGTDECGWTELYSGKRGMVRAGGSASQIIGDRGATDPGGGKRTRGGGGRPPAWQQPLGDARGSSWTSDVQAFPALGSHSSTKAGRRERRILDTVGDVAGDGIARFPVSSPEIDTGCQVTILATTIFEHMCTADPRVRSRLRPCRRRLVSADSSPLTVKGELELNVIFPGLCCEMLFVVYNIGLDGLLGVETLQSCLPHQLDLRTGELWAASRSTLQLHQQRLIPEVDGFLTTTVLPPDSEIVAPFSVSGV